MIAHVVHDVGYMPKPNLVEIILTDEVADARLTKTAFIIPVFDNGDILLAFNPADNRGVEIAGGHVEEGETLEQAAVRECLEEVGCHVVDLTPIGYLRLTCLGEIPEGYRYPHPVSYQQFYAGRVARLEPAGAYECGEPVRTAEVDFARPSVSIFGRQARSVVNQLDALSTL